MAGQTLYDKLWHNHVVVQRDDGSALIYIDRHLIHEVTSPQAFEGLRLAGRNPVAAGRQPGGAGSQRAHRAGGAQRRCRGHRRPGIAAAGADPRRQLSGLRHRRVRNQRPPPGHRPCGGPGAGRNPAGHDGGLRRFPHLHPRRPGRPGPRHRHLGGGACAGHPVPDPAENEKHAGAHRRRAADRGDRQGCGAGGDRQDRHRRRQRLRHRVWRRGGARHEHGGPHDHVQYVHRGRRAHGHGGGR